MVDNVLEAIRIGMEINQPQYNQRRIAEAKLLGELYNYRMVESNIIFNTLYLVISFGALPDGTFYLFFWLNVEYNYLVSLSFSYC